LGVRPETRLGDCWTCWRSFQQAKRKLNFFRTLPHRFRIKT
jgi:hypothetical protein